MSCAPLLTVQIERLTVRVYPDREVLGAAAGADVSRAMRDLLGRRDRIRMIFASAASQVEMLDALGRAAGVDWARVSAFHMDEYVGLPVDSPQSFGAFLQARLFQFVRPGEVFLIRDGGDPEALCRRYAAQIAAAPIDIVCLGIGENGHLAFNDPHVADFADPAVMKPVTLEPASRQQQVNDGAFATVDAVPTQAVTLTIPALMAAAHLFCVVPGARKRAAVDATLYGAVTPACPASRLRGHPDCTLYLDKDSAPRRLFGTGAEVAD